MQQLVIVCPVQRRVDDDCVRAGGEFDALFRLRSSLRSTTCLSSSISKRSVRMSIHWVSVKAIGDVENWWFVGRRGRDSRRWISAAGDRGHPAKNSAVTNKVRRLHVFSAPEEARMYWSLTFPGLFQSSRSFRRRRLWDLWPPKVCVVRRRAVKVLSK